MSKRKYNRRDSGLLIPGNDSIELPKPAPPKPWYAGKLWPWRGMSRRKCCCGVPCGCCNGNRPNEWSAEVSGVADYGYCTTCDEKYNDTFILSPETPYADPCAWVYYMTGPSGIFMCAESSIAWWIYYAPSDTQSPTYCNQYSGYPPSIRLYFGFAWMGYSGNWVTGLRVYYDYGENKPDCTPSEPVTLSLSGWGTEVCNWTNAQVVLTAL